MPSRDPRRMPNGTRIPMPMGDPRKGWTPPAISGTPGSSPEGANVNVKVEPSSDLNINVKIDASSYFSALVERMEKAIKLVGSLANNGPGSSGQVGVIHQERHYQRS